MSKVRLYGATSGYVEIAAEDVAPDATVTIPNSAIATESYVDSATSGLATESYVDSATSGLASTSYVDSQVATRVSKTNVSGNVFVVFAERNGVPTVGNNYAMGNGASDMQATLPFACELIALGGVGGPVHSGTTTARMVKNGSLQSSTYQVSFTDTTSAYVTFATPLSFAAGDTFNAQVVAVGTGDGGVITFVFRMV